MTKNLKNILDCFKAKIDNWNNGVVATEEVFIDGLRKTNQELTKELEKQEPKKIQMGI